MPMLTTPARSHIRPHSAPSVITIEAITVERSMPTRLNEPSAAAQERKANTSRASPAPRMRFVRCNQRRRRQRTPSTAMRTAMTRLTALVLNVQERSVNRSVGRLRLKVDVDSAGTPRAKTHRTTTAMARRAYPTMVARRSSGVARVTTGATAAGSVVTAVMRPTLC